MNYSTKHTRSFSLHLIGLLFICNFSFAQDSDFKQTSIGAGFGFATNDGKRETGEGLIYMLGCHKSYGEKNKLRLNPNIIVGSFSSSLTNDIRDQFYRITSLGLNLHFDLIRFRALSVVTTAGGFTSYSRGLFGTGGWPGTNNGRSEYFSALYAGWNLALGFRVAPKESQLTYEFTPVSFQFSGDDFLLTYLMLGIDFRLKK